MKFRIIYDGNSYRVEIMYPHTGAWVIDSFHETYEDAVKYAFQKNGWVPVICSEMESA
jgi:hypothetical protein